MLTGIDLFSGVGGLSLGFVRNGCNIMVANEIDYDISQAYAFNHPGTKVINKDITSLDISSVFQEYRDKIDIVFGGPPCQGFSQKGSRKTIHDKRNFLFRYFYDVVEYLKPKYFLMENVPNLLTAENGLFKNEIVSLFSKIGYSLDCNVLNAAEFGVPQIRRRAFILGKKGATSCILPSGNSKRVCINDAISDLAFLDSGEGSEVQNYRFDAQSEYQRKMRKDSKKLYNHIATNHSKDAILKMKMIPIGMGKEVLPEDMLTKSIYSGTWSRMIANELSVTITTRFDTPSSGRFMHPYLDRCITPREAARIQSFPDTFIFYGPKTSQMKQIGNAVPPLLSQAIAETIIKDNQSDG